jgi:hypothetical protein
MKNVLKKVSAILLTIAVLTPLGGVSAFAKVNNNYDGFTIGVDKSKQKISRRIVSCDDSPTRWHEVYSRGMGILKRGDGSLVFNNGCTWQCKYCGEVILTKGEVPMGQIVGTYATWYPGYTVSQNGTVLTTDNIYYCGSSSLEGFNFRYN